MGHSRRACRGRGNDGEQRIDDGQIEPVGELTGLRSRLPDSLQSESLAPLRHVKVLPDDDGKVKDASSDAIQH
ncbi:MAG TPA: hypothetical protein VMA73_20025 [Streptosporangiaceae bacterium]|nr:hypothetical protein [Streptosporangiaceae bacterium]